MSVESVETTNAFNFTVDKTNNTLLSVSFRTLTPEEVKELDNRRAERLDTVERLLNTPATESISQQDLLRCIAPVLSGGSNGMSNATYRACLIYLTRYYLTRAQRTS